MGEQGSGVAVAVWSGAAARRWSRIDVDQAMRGDREAFDRLLLGQVDPAFRLALAIVGNEDDARDACQEAFVSAWRDLPRLREPDRFDAWFGRILVNACRDARRAGRRRVVREITVNEAIAESVPSRVRPLDQRAAELDALDRAFQRLSDGERAILALHHLEHRSLAEIARLLGIPEGTVKSRLHAARRSFKRAWR